MKKVLSLLLACLLLLTLFSGCSKIQIQDHADIRAGVDAFLAAVFADNADSAYGTIYSGFDRTEFAGTFAQIQGILADVESYELTPIQYDYSNQNGIATSQLAYRMDTNAGAFIVTASVVDGYEGLTSFYVTPEDQTALTYTGTPGHMDGANAVQWTILAVGILTWVFVIWVFVDCCRRKIRLKALWLLLVLLGALILSVSVSGGSVNFRFNVGVYLTLSSLVCFGDGSLQLRLVIPLGAVIYLLIRKKLIAKVAPKTPAAEEPVAIEEIPSTDPDDTQAEDC